MIILMAHVMFCENVLTYKKIPILIHPSLIKFRRSMIFKWKFHVKKYNKLILAQYLGQSWGYFLGIGKLTVRLPGSYGALVSEQRTDLWGDYNAKNKSTSCIFLFLLVNILLSVRPA